MHGRALEESFSQDTLGFSYYKYRMNWICAFWGGHPGGPGGCRCRVLLRVLLLVVCALWGWPAGAAAGCRLQVLL